MHVAVDDYSRAAYVEVLRGRDWRRRRRASIRRSIGWLGGWGMAVAGVLTDNGRGYISRRFQVAAEEMPCRTHAHAALSPPNERQGGTVHPDPDPRLGVRGGLSVAPGVEHSRSGSGFATTTSRGRTRLSVINRRASTFRSSLSDQQCQKSQRLLGSDFPATQPM